MRPDVAGEHRRRGSRRSARGSRSSGSTIRAQRQQHALLVVADRARGAGGQDQLAPVGVDVGARGTRRRSSSTAACASRTSRSSSPASTSGPCARSAASVPSKCMNATATCRCSGSVTPASRELAGGERHAPHQQLVRYLGQDRDRPGGASPAARATQEHRRRPSRRRTTRGGQQRGGRRAHHDLAGVGRALHRDDPVAAGPVTIELAVRVADEEEVERAAVHADRHPQVDPCRPGSRSGRPWRRRLRIPIAARAARAACVARSPLGKQHEQRVAAELQQAPALVRTPAPGAP